MKVHLIVQYYAEARDDRRSELHFCLRKNLNDPRIAGVHDVQSIARPPADIAEHTKYRAVPSSDWLTYEAAFHYANQHLAGEFVAVANLDVFLSQDFPMEMLSKMSRSVVLALARWEYDPRTERMWLDPTFADKEMAFSQDMWIFKSPVHVRDCDFKLGIVGCDHAIAHRFQASGYTPVNDCLRFRICHYDLCRGKDGANGLQFHKQRADIQTFPGREGRLLVPMLREGLSLDEAAKRLGLGEIAKYRALLDMWNANMGVRSFEDLTNEGNQSL